MPSRQRNHRSGLSVQIDVQRGESAAATPHILGDEADASIQQRRRRQNASEAARSMLDHQPHRDDDDQQLARQGSSSSSSADDEEFHSSLIDQASCCSDISSSCEDPFVATTRVIEASVPPERRAPQVLLPTEGSAAPPSSLPNDNWMGDNNFG
ncbi:hypothetical protein BC940DRAFT_337980, partial [Gongronella butleri]